MSHQETIRDIPASDVDRVMAQFVSIGATPQKIDQGGGLFTVVATFEGSAQLAPFATESAAEVLAVVPSLPDVPLPKIDPSTDFSKISGEYRAYFDACTVLPARRDAVEARLRRLLDNAPRYRALGDTLGIPWFFIGIIHSLEASSNFTTHLHNGDPLTARTVQVPAGRPGSGSPPFTWEASARDALAMKGYLNQTDWSTARMLHRWEGYNGFGYRARSLPSAYLWSFSPLYRKGRFVADHKFDPESVSQQCGAAVLLKALLART